MNRSQEEQSPLFLMIRNVLQDHHFSKRTEQNYIYWIKKFIYFHKERHPMTLGEAQVQEFLYHLSVRLEVTPSSQSVALNAVSFMFKHILGKPLEESKLHLYSAKHRRTQDCVAL